MIIIIFCHDFLTIPKREYEAMNFDGFDNESGLLYNIVPNIIHFIRFNKTEFTFIDIVVIRAAHLAQKPDAIYIHTDITAFQGKYWNKLQEKWPDTYKLIEIKARKVPLKVFNRPISEEYKFYHASDVERYRLLAEYGGIYLDNDVFIINNLDKYRKYEMTLEWNLGVYLGNQLLIGHKDSRFLHHCKETFRDYRADLWYYNGGQLPTTAVLYKYPQFIHRVIQKFGTDTRISVHLYTDNWSGWKEFDAIHLLINHRYYMFKANYQTHPYFDEQTILKYNFTFGEMVRSIYYR
jgi:hypothetical protein